MDRKLQQAGHRPMAVIQGPAVWPIRMQRPKKSMRASGGRCNLVWRMIPTSTGAPCPPLVQAKMVRMRLPNC